MALPHNEAIPTSLFEAIPLLLAIRKKSKFKSKHLQVGDVLCLKRKEKKK